jgi:hypothetical protein
MGRLYSISFVDVAVTAAQDLFEILAPADAVMILHALSISQSSDAGDAESEQLTCSVRRVTGAPTSGSGGSTPTPAPLEQGDAAAGITAEANNTTQLSGGTNTVLWVEAFNVMAGFIFAPTPEMRPVISPSTRLLVELENAPADSLTMSGTLIVEEIGG